jgi:Carboxypeptidase regulatory-like domain
MTRAETGVCRSMWKRAGFAVFAIAVVFAAQLLLMIPTASAQSIFATLSGTVRDASGAVVPGASIAIKNTSSQTVYPSVTNGEGYFSVNTLPFGTYEVRASAKGFTSWVVKDVVLNASDSKRVAIDLKVATSNELVEVVAVAPGVVTVDSGDKSYTIETKDLQELSLVGRNASELVKVLPGATMTANGGLNKPAYSGEVVGLNFSMGGQTGGLGSVVINGQAAEITQDGQRTMDPGAFGTATPIVPNPDMIAEVKVLTSNFTAENTQGPVVVNSVTQSGGSSFHGNLRLNARNTALNSIEEFTKLAKAPKSDSSYYYPGFSVGGPVPGFGRKKLFFFDGFEYYKQQVDGGVERSFVPTPTMINSGDFSSLIGYAGNTNGRGSLYNAPAAPAAGASLGFDVRRNAGCTITGSVLSPACIDPNAQKLLLDEMPVANVDPLTHDGFNYVQSTSVAQNSWQNMVRGDYNIADNTKAYVTWSRHRETNNMPFGLWNSAGDYYVPAPSPVVGANGADNYTVTFLHVFSPTMTAEGKFGYMKLNLPSSPSNHAKLDRSATTFPLKGYYNPTNVPALLSWGNSFPYAGDVGHSYHPTMIAVKAIPSASAGLTKVIGTHTAKFGYYWEHLYNKQDNWGQYMGVFTYAPWNSSPTGNEFADALMGIGQTGYFENAQPPASEVAQNISSFYAQDDWKLSRRITVQFGMRFEHIAKPYSPTDNFGLAIFDRANYATGNGTNPGVLYHGIDSSLSLSGVNSRFLFFSPRFGAAIDLFGTGKTVLRGGWGKYRAFDSVQSNSYTGPAGTALGSVGFGCNYNDPNCPTWEDVDLHQPGCAIGNCAPAAVFGKPQLQNGSFSAVDPRFNDQPLVTSYSLNIDQQLPSKFTMELSYVGNHSDFLQGTANINAVPIGTLTAPGFTCPAGTGDIGSATCQQTVRPYSKYQNVTGSVTAGKAQFDSLQASLQRNVGWLSMGANYTWSKALGIGWNINNGTLTGTLPDFGAHYLWGVLPIDRGQAFSATYVFRLPKLQAGNALVKGLANGWVISGITQVESGAQVTNQSGSGGLNFNMLVNGTNQDNVHLLGTPDITLYPRITCKPNVGVGMNQFINPKCFAPPSANQLGTGSAPYMAGPMFWSSDLTLLKHVKITERQNLEFKFAAFNPLHHSLLSFAPGDSNLHLIFNDLGQVITGTSCPGTSGGASCTQPSTFGVATTRYGVRTLELGVKWIF